MTWPMSLDAMVRYRWFCKILWRENGRRILLLGMDATTFEVGLEYRF